MVASPRVSVGGPESVQPFHRVLRSETRTDHEAVDDRFARFDLTDRDDYACFLTAHAMVLPALEAALAPERVIPGWQGRTAALLADLDTLGVTAPPLLCPLIDRDSAARWGAIYVVEGSRLGGAHLARQVGDGLPRAYLSAAHSAGGWKRILAAIDLAAGDTAWQRSALAAAKGVFANYADAADRVSHG